jgi:hypothetical protein
MSTHAPQVTFENFVRTESERMFASIVDRAGGSNRWQHSRVPTPMDAQPIIRMNRDTLYSSAVIDVSAGATITMPEAGDRYVSVMLVNQDHHIHRILHEPGTHELTAEELGGEFVLAAARILVDPADGEDVAAVNALQDQLALTSVAGREFVPAPYEPESFERTRSAVLQLARGMTGAHHTFGREEDVDTIRHLLGTAVGWGGLPESEAYYVNVSPGLPVGEYELTVGEVPVDGFWSLSVYDADGFFDPAAEQACSLNDLTGERDADGRITVRFGPDANGPNRLMIGEGWNYLVRLYRPRPEVLDGTWTFPVLTAR